MKENILLKLIARLSATIFVILLLSFHGFGREWKDTTQKAPVKTSAKNQRLFYGQASFYSNKFHGRRTANGEIFNQDKMTAACNILPLGTWIRVTNMRNGKAVVVKTTDRLHPRMRRLVDLSRAAAKKLGYISSGLTRVKVEVLNQKLYK